MRDEDSSETMYYDTWRYFGYETTSLEYRRKRKPPVELRMTKQQTICSIKGLPFGRKDYSKELKTVKSTSFLGQTS